MASWCSNYLVLSGRCGNFVKQLKKHDYKAEGFTLEQGEYMFDVDIYEDKRTIGFESKWSPPLEGLLNRARKGRFSFEIQYEERGMAIYGMAFYNAENDHYEEYDLPQDTLDKIEWSDEGELTIDGEVCESEYDWLEEQMNKFIESSEKPHPFRTRGSVLNN